MTLCFANAAIKSERFDSALDRTFQDRKALQSRLDTVMVEGCFNTLGFVMADYPSNFFEVNRKTDGSLYQVTVGYDLTSSYPPDEDTKVISMMAAWVRRVFQESEGYAAKRTELLDIVNRWEEDAVKRIMTERRIT